MTSKLAPEWLACQAPGVIGSAQGLYTVIGEIKSVICNFYLSGTAHTII